MKPSSSASFSHGHSRHHQRWWWFLIFLSLKPRPKCLDLLSKPPVLKSWSQGYQRRWFPPILLKREKDYQKKEKKRVQWERNLPILLICSLNLQQWDFGSVGSFGFHFCCVFRFGCVDFSTFFFFFFTGFDGHGGVVVVQWFLWDWWLLRWCVGRDRKSTRLNSSHRR